MVVGSTAIRLGDGGCPSLHGVISEGGYGVSCSAVRDGSFRLVVITEVPLTSPNSTAKAVEHPQRVVTCGRGGRSKRASIVSHDHGAAKASEATQVAGLVIGSRSGTVGFGTSLEVGYSEIPIAGAENRIDQPVSSKT